MQVNLTIDQENALNGILEFIYKPTSDQNDIACILSAAAGCGKTYLTKVIVNKVRNNFAVVGVAPTHKARKVLDTFLNSGSFIKVKTMTIASLLSKIKQHNYIGTKHYSGGSNEKMQKFDLFIIDEASMITDNDINSIINFAFELKRKVVFIGDKYQIPNPSQKYICKNGFATKKESSAFDLKTQFHLTTNMRQKENNPLVELYTELLDSIKECKEAKINKQTKFIGDIGIKFYDNNEKWITSFCETYNSAKIKHDTRMLSYTNERVKTHNLAIRKLLKLNNFLNVGELLMGYNNLGWPVPIIENGQDYYIIDVKYVNDYMISSYKNLVGYIVKIQNIYNTNETISTIFMPDITNVANLDILNELVKRANKVNEIKSTKDSFKKYIQLKNQLVFMENIYNYNGSIIGEGEFKHNHPLLFKSVVDMIEDLDEGNRKIIENELSTKINTVYNGILQDRIHDDKPLTPVERLCDKYCVIQKDIDYGYCITAHKSQGSTFHTVFIDETDFEKLQNYWSYDLDCYINAVKEKGQLKYVCYTRPTNTAHVLY
jgi:hypothetical protein